MKIAIMQPYFFPYLGYFQLIAATDEWIVFDIPQYIRHGWINRNRILKFDGCDWQYINVPLKKHQRETTIREIEISDSENWRAKILAQIIQYKKKAPYYNDVINIIKMSINIETNSIVDLNVNALSIVCNYLGINFNYKIYSEMNIIHDEPKHAGEWALNICKAVNAKTYINPPGGKEIFNLEQFQKAGIKLFFLESQLNEYNQKNNKFISGLSIIDIMMFNSKEKIKEKLNQFKLI